MLYFYSVTELTLLLLKFVTEVDCKYLLTWTLFKFATISQISASNVLHCFIALRLGG